MTVPEIILLDFENELPEDWNKMLWVELDADFHDEDEAEIIVVDYD